MATPTTKAKKAVAKVATTAKDAAEKTGKYMTQNPKATLYVVGGVLGVFVAYRLLSTVKKGADKLDEVLTGDPNIDDNVQVVNVPTPNATITDYQAEILAGQLLDAMNAKQPIYGTDEDLIEAVFDVLRNADDFMKVFKAFGMKDYNGNNSPPTGIWSNLDSYKKQHLVYWLYSELSSWWGTSTAYKKVKSRVESAGFVFG